MSNLESTGEREDEPAHFGRPKLYDYDTWLDCNPHYIVRGKDYSAQSEAMRVNLFQNAKKRGLKVKMQRDSVADGYLFQAYLPHEMPPKLPSIDNLRAQGNAALPRCVVCEKPLDGQSITEGQCMYLTKDWELMPVHAEGE